MMDSLMWTVPRDLLDESIAIMRPRGLIGHEGLALWLGRADAERVDITHVIEVDGAGFQTTPFHLSLSLRAMATLTEFAAQHDRFLVGQIHSHPKLGVGLSKLDVQQGIRIPDYLSVVCPHYAQRDLSGISECGVHVFEDGRYRRLPEAEIDQRLVVADRHVVRLHCEVPA